MGRPGLRRAIEEDGGAEEGGTVLKGRVESTETLATHTWLLPRFLSVTDGRMPHNPKT